MTNRIVVQLTDPELQQQGSDDFEKVNRGELYLSIAETITDIIGPVDPTLLAKIVENEIAILGAEAGQARWIIDLAAGISAGFRGDATPSYGLGQVKTGTAIDLLEEYPELLSVLNDPILSYNYHSNSDFNDRLVANMLLNNDRFNLVMAAAYVADLRKNLKGILQEEWGIAVGDEPIGFPQWQPRFSISEEELDKLTAIAYATGLSFLTNGFAIDETPRDVIETIIGTIAANTGEGKIVTNVFNQREKAEEVTGIPYGTYRYDYSDFLPIDPTPIPENGEGVGQPFTLEPGVGYNPVVPAGLGVAIAGIGDLADSPLIQPIGVQGERLMDFFQIPGDEAGGGLQTALESLTNVETSVDSISTKTDAAFEPLHEDLLDIRGRWDEFATNMGSVSTKWTIIPEVVGEYADLFLPIIRGLVRDMVLENGGVVPGSDPRMDGSNPEIGGN